MNLQRWMIPLAIAVAVPFAALHFHSRGDASAAILTDDAFWKLWGDGQGEVSSYDLTIPRYGELRRGTAVLIFVTETFSNESRVKADPGKHPPSDEFPVMKLNLIQDFATGIYEYNLMTSTFVALAPVNGLPAGAPTKISFSAQDWCSHVYHQLLFDERSIQETRHSYFDGEGDHERALANQAGGVAEETLLLWARGFAAPRLENGESKEVPFLISCQRARLEHRPVEWTTATLSRSKELRKIETSAGTFEVETCIAAVAEGRKWTISVEKAPPHRIVRWETTEGESGELLAGERMKYWEMNDEKFIGELKRLHLAPRPKRTM